LPIRFQMQDESYPDQTEPEGQLAARVRGLLRGAKVDFTELFTVFPPAATSVTFHVKVAPGLSLNFEVSVGMEQFDLVANHANVRLPLDYFDTADEWVNVAAESLDALLHSDLRIRVSRFFRITWGGAIWIPTAGHPDGGVWSGEGFAARGAGKEFVFPRPWYSIADDGPTPRSSGP